jgi:hypothetical protein
MLACLEADGRERPQVGWLRSLTNAWLNEGSSTRFCCQRRAAVRAVVDSDPAAAGLRGDSDEPPTCLRPPFESQIEVARPCVCLEEFAAGTEAGWEQRSALGTDRPIRVFVRSCHRPIVPLRVQPLRSGRSRPTADGPVARVGQLEARRSALHHSHASVPLGRDGPTSRIFATS